MTVYLQPGDMIHLAIPIDTGLLPKGAREQGEKLNKEFTESYARLGVTIFHWTGVQGLDRPEVVSVIRSSKAGLARRGPWYGDLDPEPDR